MQLGLENKKQTQLAIGLGVAAVVAVAYFVVFPMFAGSPASPSTSAPGTAAVSTRASARGGPRGKKVRPENLDPTLRLDLLASTERTVYEGNGVNIFASRQEVVIPTPGASGVTDAQKAAEEAKYQTPTPPPPPQIPLKFFGFASKPGEPKKVFLSHGEDVFVAGEGEIVNRQYKVVRISPTSVEMQDMVNSGPPQSIPLTQG